MKLNFRQKRADDVVQVVQLLSRSPTVATMAPVAHTHSFNSAGRVAALKAISRADLGFCWVSLYLSNCQHAPDRQRNLNYVSHHPLVKMKTRLFQHEWKNSFVQRQKSLRLQKCSRFFRTHGEADWSANPMPSWNAVSLKIPPDFLVETWAIRHEVTGWIIDCEYILNHLESCGPFPYEGFFFFF